MFQPIRMFRNMKLYRKLLLSYLFVILLPVIIISYFLIQRTTETIQAQTNAINQINFKQMKSNIENQLDSYLKLSESILVEKQLLDFINEEHTESKTYFDKLQEYSQIYKIYQMKLPITNSYNIKMSVYTTNDTLLIDNGFLFDLNDLMEETWIREILDRKGENVLAGPYLNKDNELVISIGKAIIPPFTVSKYTNILRLEIPEVVLYRLIEKEGVSKQIYVLDGQNQIITTTERSKIGKLFDVQSYFRTDLFAMLPNTPISFKKMDIFTFYDKIYAKNALRQWKVISIISTKDLQQQVEGIVRYIIFICIASLIIAVIFVLLFSNTLTSRLKLLVRNMSMIRDGKFDVFVAIEDQDEIGLLSRSFRKMVDRINVLNNEVYISELHIKDLEIETNEAKFHALQSQINPHFLFNTMESIRMNLLNKNDHETSDIIQTFGKLLRKSIDWSHDKVTLGQELELVEQYLKIQKYRYRNKLQYTITIDDALKQYQIPKYTLQPIVENAIYHGIEMKEHMGTCRITAWQDNQFLVLSVVDDGVGMDSVALEGLRAIIYAEDTHSRADHIGLNNVHQRLKLNYGDGYGITIESAKDAGTIIELRIPLQKGDTSDV